MKILRTLLAGIFTFVAVVLATPSARAGDYREHTVAIDFDGGNLAGTLTLPGSGARHPIVLLLHGMGGERKGPRIRLTGTGLFQRTARILAQNGLASLAISTGGKGGSQGDYRDMTLERRIGEALAAVDWIAGRDDLEHDGIAVLGHSQGTIVASVLAGRLADTNRIGPVILWAPQSDAYSTYRRAMGAGTFDKALHANADEILRWDGLGGKQREFRAAFVHGLEQIDVLGDIARHEGPLLVVTGRKDRASPPASARIFAQHHPNGATFAEFDVGHRMGAGQGVAKVDEVARHTLAWLQTAR